MEERQADQTGSPVTLLPEPIHIPLPQVYLHPPIAQRAPETPKTTDLPTSRGIRKIGPFEVSSPHPLLWLCFLMSFVALVLDVPKGSLPTLTGRHKALRVRTAVFMSPWHTNAAV
jgi:hypothetical protein